MSQLSETNTVRSFIGSKTPEQKEASIQIIQNLLDDFKDGRINAILAVGVMPTDNTVFYTAHMRDSFTLLSQLGAVSALDYFVKQKGFEE